MDESRCGLCGELMPPGEEMFKFHGYSGPCPRQMMSVAKPDSVKPKWYTWDQVSRDIHDEDIWWWDNGDQIFTVNVAFSHDGQVLCRGTGRFGCGVSREISEMGGKWSPCIAPERDAEEATP